MTLDLDQYDVLGRVRLPCTECRKDFIYQHSSRSYSVVCASCIRKICYEPWNECFELYRALRPDENDVFQNGFHSRNPEANYDIQTHVEYGSRLRTQYILPRRLPWSWRYSMQSRVSTSGGPNRLESLSRLLQKTLNDLTR